MQLHIAKKIISYQKKSFNHKSDLRKVALGSRKPSAGLWWSNPSGGFFLALKMAKKTFRIPPSRKGMTMTELMVTLGIVGILLAIGIPGYLNSLPHRRLKASAMEIACHMKLARIKALSVGINCGVTLGIGATNFTVFIDSGSTSNALDNGDEIIKRGVPLRKGIWITGNTFSGEGSAIFRPKGTAKGGSVILTNGTETLTISVLFTTGRIRIK